MGEKRIYIVSLPCWGTDLIIGVFDKLHEAIEKGCSPNLMDRPQSFPAKFVVTSHVLNAIKEKHADMVSVFERTFKHSRFCCPDFPRKTCSHYQDTWLNQAQSGGANA